MRHLLLFAVLALPLAAHADDFDWAVGAFTTVSETMKFPTNGMTQETFTQTIMPVQNCAEPPVVQQNIPQNELYKVTSAQKLRLNAGGQSVVGAPQITSCTGKVVWQAVGGALYVDAQPVAQAITYHLSGDAVIWYDAAGEHVLVTSN